MPIQQISAADAATQRGVEGVIYQDTADPGKLYVKGAPGTTLAQNQIPAVGAELLEALDTRPYLAETPYTGLNFASDVASALDFQTTGRNLHTFRRALRRSRASFGTANQAVVRVLMLTDSTGENVSQNYPAGHWVATFERLMQRRWPDAAFEFINVGVGGRQVKNVLGYQADLVTQNYLSQASEPTDGSGYYSPSNTGETARAHPWTWMGPPTGVTAFGVGEIWADRAATYRPHLVITSFGLNEYNRLFGYQTRFVEAYELLINDIRSGARWAASRPSLVIGTPYGDNTDGGDMVKRNRLAVITRGLAAKHGCPLFDGNRWYNILRRGRDPLRYRVYGEVFGRYLRTSRDNGIIRSDHPDYWFCPLATPTSSGAAATFISSNNQAGIFLRKRAARNVDISHRFAQSSAAATGVARLFARVDPAQWYYSGTGVASDPVNGYEARYSPSGLLELIYKGSVLTSVQCDAWSTLSQALRMQLRVVETMIEVWTAVGSAAPSTGSSWARRIRFRHLQAHDVLEEAVQANKGPHSTREDGWCGFGHGTTGANTPASICLNSDRQCMYYQFLDDLPVTQGGVFNDADLQGGVNDWTGATVYNPDSPGGNVINHMTTDGYEATYAVPVAALVNTLADSDAQAEVLGDSTTKVAFTSNVTAAGSIARSGTTATFTWTAHGYAVGQAVRVTCSGAGDAGYNVTHECTATDANSLTATVSGSLAASEATVTLTTRNVEQVLATIPLPASWFGLDGQILVEALGNVTNSANNKTYRLRLGTTGAAAQQGVATTVTTSESVVMQTRLVSRGDASQLWAPNFLVGASSADALATAVNTTGLVYLYITAQAAAAANEEASLESYCVRLVS